MLSEPRSLTWKTCRLGLERRIPSLLRLLEPALEPTLLRLETGLLRLETGLLGLKTGLLRLESRLLWDLSACA